MLVLGVDPGINGAIALLDTAVTRSSNGLISRVHRSRIEVWDYPKLKVTISRKARERIDLDATWRLIMDLTLKYDIDLAVLEEPGRRGQQNAGAAVTFGHAAGAIEAFIVAACIPRRYVQPNAWKKATGVPCRGTRKERKDASRLAAKRLFPASSASFARVKDDGRAEAALLAYYGRVLLGAEDRMELTPAR